MVRLNMRRGQTDGSDASSAGLWFQIVRWIFILGILAMFVVSFQLSAVPSPQPMSSSSSSSSSEVSDNDKAVTTTREAQEDNEQNNDEKDEEEEEKKKEEKKEEKKEDEEDEDKKKKKKKKKESPRPPKRFDHVTIPPEGVPPGSDLPRLLQYQSDTSRVPPEVTDLPDSSTATVMGLASGYRLDVYQKFVGSLRNAGFAGHIILGVAPDINDVAEQYLVSRGVTVKKMTWVNCTYADFGGKKSIFKKTYCSHPYPDIKIRWSRYPLGRDWLQECETCTGPVLFSDVRDAYFQDDPFGPGSPKIQGLHVFEEWKNLTTTNWLTSWPINDCKGVGFDKPMLCSGTTIGTRKAMLQYLTDMYEEMKVWIADPKCRFDINGDDQSIHNYLYYSDKLPYAQAIANREGIVNTVGNPAYLLWKTHVADWEAKVPGIERNVIQNTAYPGADGQNWLGEIYGWTDDEGYILNYDGTRSRVVHQYDRFSFPFIRMWLDKQDFYHDPYP